MWRDMNRMLHKFMIIVRLRPAKALNIIYTTTGHPSDVCYTYNIARNRRARREYIKITQIGRVRDREIAFSVNTLTKAVFFCGLIVECRRSVS